MLYLDTINWICRGYSPLPAHVLQSSSWLQSYSHDHRRTLTNTILDVEQNLATAPSSPDSGSNFKTTYGITHGPGASILPHVRTAVKQKTAHWDLFAAEHRLYTSLLDIGEHVNEIQTSTPSTDSSNFVSDISNSYFVPPVDISLEPIPPTDVGEQIPHTKKTTSTRKQKNDTTENRGTKRSAADVDENNDKVGKAESKTSTTFKTSKTKICEHDEFPDFFYAHDAEKYAQYRYSCSRDRRINDFLNRSLKYHWAAGHFHDEFETTEEATSRYWRVMDAQPDPSLSVSGAEYRAIQYKVKLEALWGSSSDGPLPRCPQPGVHRVYDVKIRGGALYAPPSRLVITSASMVGDMSTSIAVSTPQVTSSVTQQAEPATSASEQSEIAVAAHIPTRSLDSMLRQAVSDTITPAIQSMRQHVNQMQQETNERLNRLEVVTAFVSMAYSNQLGSEYPKFTLEDDQLLQAPRLAYEPSSSTSAQDLGSVSTQREHRDRETPPTEPDAADDNGDDNMHKSSSQ